MNQATHKAVEQGDRLFWRAHYKGRELRLYRIVPHTGNSKLLRRVNTIQAAQFLMVEIAQAGYPDDELDGLHVQITRCAAALERFHNREIERET